MASDYKNQLIDAYNKLVKGIEKKNVKDGRGKYFIYTCGGTSEHQLITTCKDKGDIPYVIKCPFCDKWMYGKTTVDSVDPNQKVMYWVRPSLEEFLKMNSFKQDHILEGYLVLEEELS